MASQLQALQSWIKGNPILASVSGAAVTLFMVAYRDYLDYVSLGPHGLPDTFWGWYKQLSWTLGARNDVTVPAPYNIDTVAGPHDRSSFLFSNGKKGPRSRPGKAPGILRFVAPQRQTTELASEKMKSKMFAYLEDIVLKDSVHFQTHLSVLEGPVPALQIKDFANIAERPAVYTWTRGEVCHIHPPDGSTHVVLSLADQRRAIELGWSRRHRLSGGMLPWNYTLIYAPRNDEEFEIWKTIVDAGTKFCCAMLGN
ncbi:hypothetical protein K491DRAFT_689997 [Lophiostoma macrostomum CBS 122681]|uniref:Luciferase domain-containing protein n=1 Tax=Lophiostoma macrostomum CBS 122681 TaxID=1314788 RepID=A0A6A6TFC4_9PLEO|nr:hypothetical protein K491DRAFT_689997 [Lophiostoma macrostomum CBS 122681]